MKKAFRILAIIVGILVLALIGIVSYVKLALPDVGEPPAVKIEVTPERVERGRYLANAVTVCMDCHSLRDWSKFSGWSFAFADHGVPGNSTQVFVCFCPQVARPVMHEVA